MRLAYADPPYLGCCKLYDHHHPDGLCWDYVETHKALADRLIGEYDGFALSLTSQSLPVIAPMFRDVARVAAWVKPFAAFKRNVRIAYTWEPVIFSPGRDSSSDGAPVGRDHLAESITMRKGFTGAKPRAFCDWVLDLFGGTGTTALVAKALGRTGISVDMSADYCHLARWRTTDPGELARAMQVDKPAKQIEGQISMLDLLDEEGGAA